MKLAFQSSTRASTRLNTSPTRGALHVQALHERVSWMFAPRACHVCPPGRRILFPSVRSQPVSVGGGPASEEVGLASTRAEASALDGWASGILASGPGGEASARGRMSSLPPSKGSVFPPSLLFSMILPPQARRRVLARMRTLEPRPTRRDERLRTALKLCKKRVAFGPRSHH